MLVKRVRHAPHAFQVTSERFFACDETGSKIWLIAMSGAVLNDIVNKIMDEYDGEREKIETEITAFLTSLIEQRWLMQESQLAAI